MARVVLLQQSAYHAAGCAALARPALLLWQWLYIDGVSRRTVALSCLYIRVEAFWRSAWLLVAARGQVLVLAPSRLGCVRWHSGRVMRAGRGCRLTVVVSQSSTNVCAAACLLQQPRPHRSGTSGRTESWLWQQQRRTSAGRRLPASTDGGCGGSAADIPRHAPVTEHYLVASWSLPPWLSHAAVSVER